MAGEPIVCMTGQAMFHQTEHWAQQRGLLWRVGCFCFRGFGLVGCLTCTQHGGHSGAQIHENKPCTVRWDEKRRKGIGVVHDMFQCRVFLANTDDVQGTGPLDFFSLSFQARNCAQLASLRGMLPAADVSAKPVGRVLHTGHGCLLACLLACVRACLRVRLHGGIHHEAQQPFMSAWLPAATSESAECGHHGITNL